MIAETPFLLSIAGISASLAGLAGLVAGLRRGPDFRSMDLFRLREIVEFAFGNVLLTLSIFPVLAAVGDLAITLRALAAAALVYSVLHVGLLVRRSRRMSLPTSGSWTFIAGLSDIGILATIILTLAFGTVGPFEALLLVLLARPMAAFLLVLASFESA